MNDAQPPPGAARAQHAPAPEQLEWHSRTRLIDEIAQVLRERIYSGRYVPGEALRQVQIAAELKVSRTPLREALRMLEMEGILKADVGGGVRVIRADYRRLIDAYLLREVIDALAARLATERQKPAAVSRLHALIAVQRQAVQPWVPDAYTKANVEFHAAIIEMAQNEFLTGQLPIVRMTSQIFFALGDDRQRSRDPRDRGACDDRRCDHRGRRGRGAAPCGTAYPQHDRTAGKQAGDRRSTNTMRE